MKEQNRVLVFSGFMVLLDLVGIFNGGAILIALALGLVMLRDRVKGVSWAGE